MNVVKEIQRINEREASRGIKASWHDQYQDSAYIFVGGLPYNMTEGDLIVFFSQYGEIADLNLVRDKDTGKPRGFAFLAYEDQRSTNLAVDNFNGTKLFGRTLRVDHVSKYRATKQSDEEVVDLEAEAAKSRALSLAPEVMRENAREMGLRSGIEDTSNKTAAASSSGQGELDDPMAAYIEAKRLKKLEKKTKKEKKEKKKEKKEREEKKGGEASSPDSPPRQDAPIHRSPSPPRRRSPSPTRRRSPSPQRRRSPSPQRRRSPSPTRRSPSPTRRSPPRRRSRSRDRSPSRHHHHHLHHHNRHHNRSRSRSPEPRDRDRDRDDHRRSHARHDRSRSPPRRHDDRGRR